MKRTLEEVVNLARHYLNFKFTIKAGEHHTVFFRASDHGYKFRFSNKERSLGTCNFKEKAIELSENYSLDVDATEHQIVDTILHEIAHAISYEVFNHSKHGKIWKNVCAQIGANPSRSKKDYNGYRKRAKYIRFCPECHTTLYYFRKVTIRAFCANCYEEKNRYVAFELIKNPINKNNGTENK